MESLLHCAETCAVAPVVLDIAGIEDKSAYDVGIPAVFNGDVVLVKLLRDKLAKVCLLRLCERRNIADYRSDTAFLFDEYIYVLVEYLVNLTDHTAAGCGEDEFPHILGEDPFDNDTLLVICHERIAESLGEVAARSEYAPCILNVCLADFKAAEVVYELFFLFIHFLPPSSSERNLSTRRRFFSSSTFSPIILEAASIARSAI